jgi:glutamate-1-semialdehyde 2,1-aminomutase
MARTKLSRAAEVLEHERREFRTRSPRSRERYERALNVLPGADTRSVTFYPPYPAVIQSASGIELIDLDGNVYKDFLLNYTSMIVGHAHPAVVAVAQAAMARGTAIAAPVPGQLELAEELVRRVDSVERVRFVNSGTEATMAAVRVARAFTGRPLVVKVTGGYHGSYPDLDITLRPGFYPAGVPESTQTRLAPYNDPDALEAVLGQTAGECACVIMEPVLGAAGVVPGERDYLVLAEEAARAAGALFVLDEVISYRLSPGGAQALHGLRPDLTAFGKIIGGGFPVGAVGGRADVMEVFAPGADPGFSHSGTFNGNPVTVAAGLTTLELLDPAAYEKLDRLGTMLADGLRRAIAETGAPAHVTHAGSLANVHFTPERPTNAETAAVNDPEATAAFHLGLLNRGIFIAPRGLLALSTVTEEADVHQLVDAATELFAALS